MKRSRFCEGQIIAILKQQESGKAIADVRLEHGISSAMFYKWKAKFGGLEVSDGGAHVLPLFGFVSSERICASGQ